MFPQYAHNHFKESYTVQVFHSTPTRWNDKLTLSQAEDVSLMDQLGRIFDSMVHEMTTDMADNDLVQFVLQSKSLEYPMSLPCMPRYELNAERIMSEVQRVCSQTKMSI